MIFGAAIVVGTALLVPVGYDLSDKAFNRGGWSSNDWETAGGIVGGGVGGVAGARAAGTGFRGGPSAGSARGGPIAAGMRRVHTGPRIVPPGQGIRLASLSRATVERNGFRFTERYHRTSRVVANSSPRQTHERRVLHEGASFALCAGSSRGGPGRAVAASLGVFTGGSPGRPRWPTGWAESLSGSLRGRVPG